MNNILKNSSKFLTVLILGLSLFLNVNGLANTQTPSTNLDVNSDEYKPVKTGEKIVTFKKSFLEDNKGLKSLGFLDWEGIDSKIFNKKEVLKVDKNTFNDLINKVGKENIKSIEDNFIQKMKPPFVPNDEMVDSQWNLTRMDSFSAWDITQGSEDVIIANLDTGIDYTHPDLIDNLWVNTEETITDNIDNDDNGYIDDIYGYDFMDRKGDVMDGIFHGGHGTMTAGVLAATTNNGIGIAGICPNCKIMSLKVYSEYNFVDYFYLAEAIYYAVDNGAKVINLELQAMSEFSIIEEAINFAYDNDVLVVGAAGNGETGWEYEGSEKPNYPAAYQNVIGVAAVESNDKKAVYSNYGSWVSISAPTIVPSTTLGGEYTYYYNGTSAATPHVSAAAGLIYSKYPNISSDMVRDRLLFGADASIYNENPSYKDKLGSGMVNIYNSLNLEECFPDVPLTNEFNTYICNLKNDNVIGGYPDGTYKPNNLVNRGAMAKFMINGSGMPINTNCPQFSDIPADYEFANMIRTLKCNGVISGYPDGTYKPNNNVDRGAMAKFIKNGFNIPTNTTCGDFLDVNPTHGFYTEITSLKCANVISGYPDGTYKPNNLVNRGAMAKFIDNARSLVSI